MEFKELIQITKRLFREYVKKYFFRLLFALSLSIVVAGSTAAIAWLLDPAVKKIFIDKDTTYAYLIPILIIVAICSIPIITQSGNKILKHALEWDFFVGVITFYLLTFFMWKKNN